MKNIKRYIKNNCISFTILVLTTLSYRLFIEGKTQITVSVVLEMFLLTTAIILLQAVTNSIRMKSDWMYITVKYIDCVALVFFLNFVFKWFSFKFENIIYVMAVLTIVFALSNIADLFRKKREDTAINKRIEELSNNK